MNFSKALNAIKEGDKVSREGWNGKGMFLFLVPGSRFMVNRPPLLGIYPEGTHIDYRSHIDMKTAQGDIVPWVASQSDLLADDWVFFDTESMATDATCAAEDGNCDWEKQEYSELDAEFPAVHEVGDHDEDRDGPIKFRD